MSQKMFLKSKAQLLVSGAFVASVGFAAPLMAQAQPPVTSRVSNSPPIVDAGADQTVDGGTSISLSGTASDVDNDPLTFEWVQVSGTNVTINNSTTLAPGFTAPPRNFSAQTLVFELRANDGSFTSADQLTITVRANQAPTANVVAPTNIIASQTVTLDGSGSTDPEDDTLIYQWSQTGGPSVTINDAFSPIASFVVPQAASSQQSYEFQLLVADSFDAVDTTRVSMTQAANGSPVADAGADQTVGGQTNVGLDGSGSSDPDGDTLFYSWAQTSGPAVTLSADDIANPTFTAPAATGQTQIVEFQLTVRDRVANTNVRIAFDPNEDSDSVAITIAANRPPVADAGGDQGPIDSGQTVTLNGSASADPDNDALTYIWTQVSGTPVTLSDANTAQPSFIAPTVSGTEELIFALTVSDGTLTSQSDMVSVGIRAVGSITLVQRISGSDTQVAFTSNIAALNASVSTSGGVGQISAANVAVGSYSVTAADLTAQGYAITDISCNDSDSVANLAGRSIALELSAGEDLVCTFTSANAREAAAVAIYSFLTGRNALILSHQPDLQRRLDRLAGDDMPGAGSASAYGMAVPGSGELPLNATLSRDSARIGTSLAMAESALGDKDRAARAFDIWAEGYFSSVSLGSQDANFSMFYLGADLRVSDGLLIGAMVSRDDYGDKGSFDAGDAEGDGWMAGPYLTARLAPQFYLEARAAWGSSDNRVSPLQGQVDAFDTNRSYYSGSLIGQMELGRQTMLRPEVTVRYLKEKQAGYIDSLNVAIPGQTVDQGDISFRPRLSHTVGFDSGWSLRPFAEVEGIYTFGTAPDGAVANLLPANIADIFGDFRGRVEGGFDVFSTGSFRASLSGFYDGIGADNYSSKGVHVAVSFGF